MNNFMTILISLIWILEQITTPLNNCNAIQSIILNFTIMNKHPLRKLILQQNTTFSILTDRQLVENQRLLLNFDILNVMI